MRIEINGAHTSISGETVRDAVAAVTRASRGIAVAVNGEVVPRNDWKRRLQPGDRVEILTATQGG